MCCSSSYRTSPEERPETFQGGREEEVLFSERERKVSRGDGAVAPPGGGDGNSSCCQNCSVPENHFPPQAERPQ
ncbi:hypothetical protein EYF80_047130 [Liparis tanakae]|uniref:Uncharacterized protein n=1 Tax=Liparis tanakae TaxID=230148 RepID=A0A4Z2FN46_9TELE|nr:hypothetical protein EYF80_047130 [Liparis tanakae]